MTMEELASNISHGIGFAHTEKLKGELYKTV